MDYSSSGSSVHGILQARMLEWVAMPFSGGSSWPRDWNLHFLLLCIGRRVLPSAPPETPLMLLLGLPISTNLSLISNKTWHFSHQMISVSTLVFFFFVCFNWLRKSLFDSSMILPMLVLWPYYLPFSWSLILFLSFPVLPGRSQSLFLQNFTLDTPSVSILYTIIYLNSDLSLNVTNTYIPLYVMSDLLI